MGDLLIGARPGTRHGHHTGVSARESRGALTTANALQHIVAKMLQVSQFSRKFANQDLTHHVLVRVPGAYELRSRMDVTIDTHHCSAQWAGRQWMSGHCRTMTVLVRSARPCLSLAFPEELHDLAALFLAGHDLDER